LTTERTVVQENTVARKENKVKKRKIRDVWKISGLLNRLDTLIIDGTLRDTGLDNVYEIIKLEFAEQLSSPSYRLDKRSFKRKVNERIWTEKVLAQVRSAIRQHADPDTIASMFSYIPKQQFIWKWNTLKGKSGSGAPRRTSFVPGIGRISRQIREFSGTKFEFEENSFDKPFVIESTKEHPLWSVLNGVNLGVPHSAVIEENPARQALEIAQYKGDDVVVLTNFLDLDIRKASGPLKVLRAIISGRNINPAVFDPEYINEVERITSKKSHHEIVYVTIAELFADSLQGWKKIVGTKQKPTYKGKIVIILGYKDEAMIAAAAYWEAHYYWRQKLNKLELERSILVHRIKKARSLEQDESDLESELDVVERAIARTRITNVSDQDFQRYYNGVLAFVVKQLEDAIPNSTVLGIRNSYLNIGGEMVKIHIPSHERPSDSLLSNYCKNSGPEILREKMAQTVVICHPHALNYRYTMRENDTNGKRWFSNVFVAPIAVDGRYMRDILSKTIRPVSGISRAVQSEQFQGGTLRFASMNHVSQPAFLSSDAMQNCAKKIHRVRRARVEVPRYIFVMVGTDTHFGKDVRTEVEVNGRLLGPPEMAMEMMRQSGLLASPRFPIHIFTLNDDPTQGNHYGTHLQPHAQKMSFAAIEKHVMAIKDPDEQRRFLIQQIKLRGEHWEQEQMESMLDRFIEPNIDFFNAILVRAKNAGLAIRGRSHFDGVPFDHRDMGAINIGTGNHFDKTTNGQLTEGFVYVRSLRDKLLALSHWQGKNRPFVEKMVCSPLYGKQFIAWAVANIPGGYEWAFDLRDTPTRMSGWGDPLLGWTRNDLQRGNYSRIMNNRVTIKICGDKHFAALASTPYAIYHMGMASTETDPYGERGFPPNNTGVTFLGLPADGPEAGPILLRLLPFSLMRRILMNDEAFDWGTFLPNPA